MQIIPFVAALKNKLYANKLTNDFWSFLTKNKIVTYHLYHFFTWMTGSVYN